MYNQDFKWAQNLEKLDSNDKTESKRARIKGRKVNHFMKLELLNLIVTRRHYPNQTLLDQLKLLKESKGEPQIGEKYKTFALSVRQMSIAQQSLVENSRERCCELIENPYSLRFHNFLELKINSTKDYARQVEEHAVHVYFKPTKLIVNRQTFAFLDNSQKEIRQDMGNLLSESSLETHYTEEEMLAQMEAFEVIE